jgi:hypothetical protein
VDSTIDAPDAAPGDKRWTPTGPVFAVLRPATVSGLTVTGGKSAPIASPYNYYGGGIDVRGPGDRPSNSDD